MLDVVQLSEDIVSSVCLHESSSQAQERILVTRKRFQEELISIFEVLSWEAFAI